MSSRILSNQIKNEKESHAVFLSNQYDISRNPHYREWEREKLGYIADWNFRGGKRELCRDNSSAGAYVPFLLTHCFK